MKYIRTKDNIYELKNKEISVSFDVYHYVKGKNTPISSKDIIKQADTIEELCDEFVLFRDNKPYAVVPNKNRNAELAKYVWKDYYCAIWTDKGLTYVAKMNESGVLELL